jgi:hypothetical protein
VVPSASDTGSEEGVVAETRANKLQRKLEECKVIEDDENIHSRLQRQINLVRNELLYLLREAE